MRLNKDRSITPAKLENLLDEINNIVLGKENDQILDMRNARDVIK